MHHYSITKLFFGGVFSMSISGDDLEMCLAIWWLIPWSNGHNSESLPPAVSFLCRGFFCEHNTELSVCVLLESIMTLTLSVFSFPMGSSAVKFLACCASILLCATTGPTISRNRLKRCLRRNTFPGGIPNNLAKLSSVKVTSKTCDKCGCVMFFEVGVAHHQCTVKSWSLQVSSVVTKINTFQPIRNSASWP